MSAREPRLSENECSLLLDARRNGEISAAKWLRYLHDNPELAAFVAAVEARERGDDTRVSAVLKRCGYRVH